MSRREPLIRTLNPYRFDALAAGSQAKACVNGAARALRSKPTVGAARRNPTPADLVRRSRFYSPSTTLAPHIDEYLLRLVALSA